MTSVKNIDVRNADPVHVHVVGPYFTDTTLVALPITVYVTEEVLFDREAVNDDDLAKLLDGSFRSALVLHRDNLISEGPTPTNH